MDNVEQDPTAHTWWEDAFGIAIAVTVCGVGLLVYRDLGLTIGGTAGIALLLHYGTDLGLGLSYFLINLPFYAFAFVKMGLLFTIKTPIAVTALSIFVEWASTMVDFSNIEPSLGTWIAAVFVGSGLLFAFRHGSSFGGIGILAAFIQEKYNVKAGYVQLLFDVGVLTVAFLLLAPSALLYSIVSVVILNIIVAVNHSRSRYVGHSRWRILS